ncbi:MAG: TonB-dependent receptor plug domain-containing protein [Bacteroidetes bacterium]|nr:TonB-dependent receptor plug domain-containing protein [Bacteroidota bacterium]
MNRLLLIALLILGFPEEMLAQQSCILRMELRDQEDKPVPGVWIKPLGSLNGALTNEDGRCAIKVPCDSAIRIEGFFERKRVFSGQMVALKDSTKYQIAYLNAGVGNMELLRITSGTGTGLNIELKPRAVEGMTGLGSGIENIIKTLPGVFSNNELSSQYSVRGGNFDENLVYVNDVEIYRPQLIHSGQQEGLSFINPLLVKNLKFSAGGFEARYGDKQSSVLDVEYRKPTRFESTIDIGLLGASLAVEQLSANRRLSGIGSLRWRSNTLVLNTLDVRGRYVTNFYDAQWLIAYRLTPRLRIEWLGNTAENRYRLNPESRETSFGTAQNAFNLYVAMGGQEFSGYNSAMSALSLIWKPRRSTELKLIGSAFATREQEVFDVFGAYSLGLLDKDPSSETYGKPIRNLGAGSFIDHGRNRLNTRVINLSQLGNWNSSNKKISLHWGARIQQEQIRDKIHEWLYNDSSEYNIPPFGFGRDSVVMDGYVSGRAKLSSWRASAHLQSSFLIHKSSNTRITVGSRSQYWSLNGQWIHSPRIQLSMEPNRAYNTSLPDSLRRDVVRLYLAGGVYNQPAFYREMRRFDGTLNTQLRAQQSIHFVAGMERTFMMWGRKFKWLSEAYYKQLQKQVPYLFDNIRIRYYAENSSKGYSWGVDNRVNGEFIPGLESWFTLSVLQSKERISYRNSTGNEVISNWLRRPTDKRVNAAIVFQDELPGNKRYRMNLNLIFGTGMPYYLGGNLRYKDIYRIPPYRRVDIGFTKVIADAESKPKGKLWNMVQSSWVSLEIYNMLGIDNVISYLWVKDFSANIYGVPEFLTGRMLNLRLQVRLN